MKRLGGIFDFATKQERLEEIQGLLEQSDVWNNPTLAQELNQERSSIEGILESIIFVSSGVEENQELLELAIEEQDTELFETVCQDLALVQQRLEKLEFQRMFSGEMDHCNAFFDIQAGSGGTEAQDWAEMILRMYLRWSESHDYKVEIVEVSAGDVAGIKSATVKVSGENAFGYLRTETGVHRLVRKSPFDSGNRRHTSFASFYAYPEVDDSVDIDINPADLRTDTYRASGAGGQHVNKTESAVRITHLPTNTVVQCQSGRSQHKNKAEAMNMLKARLYELEMQTRRDQAQAVESEKSDIGWGQQIRSYVLDQSRIA